MNPEAFESFWLLAQHWRWKHLGDRFGSSGAELSTTDLLLLAAVIGLAIFAVFVLQRYAPRQSQRAYNDPRQLFRELCRSHGLRGSDRRLLRRLAGWRGLSHPAMVFVTPECFDTAALPPELQDAACQVARLRVRLFQTV